MESTERILVTGGAGFIGSHLVDALVERGHHVRVLDNLDPQVHGALAERGSWPSWANPEAEYHLGDMRDRVALARALHEIDVVYHQAAAVGVGQSMYDVEHYVDVNTRGTAVLLDILANDGAIRQRVRKLVVASSMSNYGEGAYRCAEHGVVHPRLRTDEQLEAREWEPLCPWPGAGGDPCGVALRPEATPESKPMYATSIYAITKKDQEEMSLAIGMAYDIPTVALRYFNVYGPRQALSNPYTGVAAIFSGRLLNGQPPVIYEDGDQARDFTHVRDIVQANLLVGRPGVGDGEVLNVGTGRDLAVRDVADALIDHLGLDLEPQVVGKFRSGDIRHCFADISRIRQLGYEPSTSFEQGVDELVAWVRRQRAEDRFDHAARQLAERGLVS